MLRLLDKPPKELFWSEPLAADSDFTLEDPLALDYLAQQVGLWLFRDLTTRTSRAQYYAVVLYGLRLAEHAIRDGKYHGDDDTRTRLFERWERFWALATIEYREGNIDRGDDDSMRGITGAKREWLRLQHNGHWNPDFELISRQNELGGLGAYLTSLRKYGLVHDGTLKVAKPAEEILKSFWSETELRDTHGRYEEYALDALNSKTIERSHGTIRLSVIRKRSRLSSILSRNEQQQRLWKALFLDAKDGTTLPLAKGLIAADREGVEEPERLLKGLSANRWGALSADVLNKVKVALAFGRFVRVLLSRFNRAYDYVDRHGSIIDFVTVSQAAFPENEMPQLRSVAGKLLNAKDASRFNKLPFHGREFVTLLKQFQEANSVECLRHLLLFQRAVQRSRQGGGEWLREENGKLAMRVPGYNGAKNLGTFPKLKLDVVRSLLRDLGKIE